MSSKTAPAYIMQELTDEQRKELLEGVGDHESAAIIVEEKSDGKQYLLHDPRPRRTLYHYTSQRQWERIQQDGYLRTGPQGFVALTDEPNLRPASPNAHWATSGPLDKTQVRITVITHEADQFGPYCVEMKVDPAWVTRQIERDNPEHWFVLDRPIPVTEWVEVRLGDTPVAKRALPRRRRDTEKPLWQTSLGRDARCDFCGLADISGACYRYECREFELDGWHNGNPNSSDLGEADWSACWPCAELIQKRDMPSLLARSDAEMHGQRVEGGGKHGTSSGVYSKVVSEARIRAFFQHYTKRRWFVGKCDLCSMHGESVHWQYECDAFTTTHPMNGYSVTSNTPWCLCEDCSKLIERRKDKALIERTLDRQVTLAEEEEGRSFPPGVRAQYRMHMTRWIGLFLKNRRGPRHPIADLPPRIEIPQAPVAAQHALDEQTTMLRWLEGSDGRNYLGGWNDRYRSYKPDAPVTPYRQDEERPATRDEVLVWSLPLRYGEAFYWEPRVADAVRQAASELSSNPDVPFILRPQTLPASYGFFYSNEQLGTSAGFPCRAIGWAIYDTMQQITADKGVHSMLVSMWAGGGGDPSVAKGIVLTFWSERPQDTVLRPSGQVAWQFGVDFRKVKAFTDGDASSDEQTTMVAALFQFIQQRIVVAGHGQPVSTSIRKRIEREYPEHQKTVRVVTLRRTQRADYQKPDEPSGRSLSVQFKVHGHWRNQCFNTAGHAEAERSGVGCNDHMTIYIHPYFKGPEDAPELPEADRVYDVAR